MWSMTIPRIPCNLAMARGFYPHDISEPSRPGPILPATCRARLAMLSGRRPSAMDCHQWGWWWIPGRWESVESLILVGGLEHVFFHILGIMIPTDELIFFRRGRAQPPTRISRFNLWTWNLLSCVKWVPKSEKKTRSQWPYFQCPKSTSLRDFASPLRFPGRVRHQPPLARQRWKLEGGGGGCDEDLQIQRKGAGCWEATPVTILAEHFGVITESVFKKIGKNQSWMWS